MADKGAQMLESLIRLWAHQNNQEIQELKIWKKGEGEENAQIIIGSAGACSSIGGMHCSSPRSEPEIETQTIAEYMDEWRRAHPNIETNKSVPVATSQIAVRGEDAAGLDFTDEESQMLLKLAMAEAEDQGVIGKALVIRVVKNRVDSEAFPNSIQDVIYDPKQFSPVWDGRYDEAVPDAECYQALEMVLNYWDGTNGALYFESEGNTINWHKDNLTELFQFDDLIFYKQGD